MNATKPPPAMQRRSKPFMEQFITDHIPLILVTLGILTSQLLMKYGISQGEPLIVTSFEHVIGLIRRILTTPVLLAGYSLSFLCGLLWLVVLGRTQLSYAVPFSTALYFILLLPVSAVLLGELVTPLRWAGVLVILAGLVLVSKGG